MEYSGEEKRSIPHLTDEQIDAIAEKAAERALEKVYSQIGKSVVSKILFLVGVATLALITWLNAKGLLGH